MAVLTREPVTESGKECRRGGRYSGCAMRKKSTAQRVRKGKEKKKRKQPIFCGGNESHFQRKSTTDSHRASRRGVLVSAPSSPPAELRVIEQLGAVNVEPYRRRHRRTEQGGSDSTSGDSHINGNKGKETREGAPREFFILDQHSPRLVGLLDLATQGARTTQNTAKRSLTPGISRPHVPGVTPGVWR